jgi:hypothetical protein
MNDKIKEDLVEMENKLAHYINKGRVVPFRAVRQEKAMAVKPDKSKIKPLVKTKNYKGDFVAVDCSTRTLKRANNWGVYLMRVAYALVRGHQVGDWGYRESVSTLIGDAHIRSMELRDIRLELESQMALDLLGKISHDNYYLFLDGASYFGGRKAFRVSLYEKCERKRIKLLAISKQSPTLHDEKGRDFMTATYSLSPYSVWVYHPVARAKKDENLYGNVSIVKLSEDALRIFRCDIMEYLSDYQVDKLLSPLTFISEDPRCLGYPVALWLAHDFSSPSDSKLLHYHDQIEQTLVDGGLLDVLRLEELSCNFPDELHGVKHPFRWEWIERV